MERQYRADGFEIQNHDGPAWESGFSGDLSVGGFFDQDTAAIHLFYAEEMNLAYKAEELAHYVQCKQRHLIGKTDAQVGDEVFEELESEMVHIMESHGFEPIR